MWENPKQNTQVTEAQVVLARAAKPSQGQKTLRQGRACTRSPGGKPHPLKRWSLTGAERSSRSSLIKSAGHHLENF
jgi:hypothetical protein